MAIVLKRDIQRRYMMTHTTGVNQTTPLGLLERMYYIQYLAGTQTITAQTSLKDLKIKWMRKWIKDKSGTAPSQNFDSDLWKAMINTITGQRAVNSTATNMMNFWLNAP